MTRLNTIDKVCIGINLLALPLLLLIAAVMYPLERYGNWLDAKVWGKR
jgi:hypothetical protein